MKDTPDPQLREALEAISKKYDEAVNNNDAAALAALYMEDAVFVTDAGPIYGRQAIEKWHAGAFQKWHHKNHISTRDQYSPHIIGRVGNEVWETGEWSETLKGETGPIQIKGYWSAIDRREGDDWKIQMVTWNINPAPAATSTPTTTPSDQWHRDPSGGGTT
jgi:ketosteroid isomerase-like protein